ncbi:MULTISPECIES: G-D-S-L family lipolytic protein [Flavobacterium]|uniref:SGNH/GDSL hydrolase family protein n=1 Tax=Flavobacterium hankyongi TaxID=1176532 RepID=A0ABP8ZPN9_9FLAO|nr:G-D-S-L family lipolytic protein [Flavobacterium sp. N1846]
MVKNIKWLLFASLSIVACNDDDTTVADEPVTAGSANFAKYVALGDSFAAGFSDGALFKKGQLNSYPEILAGQFKQVGGGAFASPLCGDDNIGGLLFMGTPIQSSRNVILGLNPDKTPNIGPLPVAPVNEVTAHLTGSFNNMGVPGAKSYHLAFAGYGNTAGVPSGAANPYFARFSSAASTSILADALTQQPTFFSLWIGGNDVLSYATSGGIGVDQTGNMNPATYGGNDITDPTVFANVYNGLATQLVTGGRKGVVANLPYVSTLPFFTTVPTNPIPARPAAEAAQLNQLFGAINSITTAMSLPKRFSTISVDDNNTTTVEAANPLLIVDETLTDLSAQITAALTPSFGPTTAAYLGNLYGRARHARNTVGNRDYILLTTRGLITPPNNIQPGAPAPFNARGVTYPLQDAQVLTADEASKIKVATDTYNVAIKTAADANGLAFVDAKTVMERLVNGGIRFGNYHMSASFVTGGVFSLDGIHPGARGYAMIANEFMKAINAKYGSTFKEVDLGQYQIQYPASL